MSVWKKFQKTYDPNLAVFTMSKKCVTPSHLTLGNRRPFQNTIGVRFVSLPSNSYWRRLSLAREPALRSASGEGGSGRGWSHSGTG